jgi:hypothetical protein
MPSWKKHSAKRKSLVGFNVMDIEIHIEELVLYGFTRGITQIDRHALAESLNAELTRLIAGHGNTPLIGHSLDITSLRTVPIQVAPGALTPTGVGTQIATTLYQSLSQQGGEGK